MTIPAECLDYRNDTELDGRLPAFGGRGSPPQPIFVLAPPRSLTSIVCAMFGQHPELYSFPETQLFTTETLADKMSSDSAAPHRIRNGLLRVVAQLYFGEQTYQAITLARAWLRRRAHFDTGYLFELLAQRIRPLRPVEKSPDMVYDVASLERALRFFPNARFIHLLRHPRGYCESNLRYYRGVQERGGNPPGWMFCDEILPDAGARKANSPILDPQKGWYAHNARIRRFLETVPQHQQTWVRGEEIVGDPDRSLRRIAEWLGVRTDPDAIELMKHPERSPYAFIGPSNAPYGNSRSFLENPNLRPELVSSYTLDGQLPWRPDNSGFFPRVKQLATEFGYA